MALLYAMRLFFFEKSLFFLKFASECAIFAVFAPVSGGKKMQKKLKRRDVVQRLGDIAFGRANDAVKLAFMEADSGAYELETLDLTMLSDIKRSTSGAVEVKLLDRFNAIRLLLEALDEPESRGKAEADRFFEAMNAVLVPETEKK